jgi:DNA repair exonuclease SbcCD ATPase subunit
MKFTAMVPLTLLLCFVSTAGRTLKAHPIENVISLLQGLMTKVEMESKAEALSYEKFEYWCKNSVKTLTTAIEKEKQIIDEMETKVAAKSEEIQTLDDQITKLDEQLGELAAADAAAKDVRDKMAKVYSEADADIASTIAAIEEAIKALQAAEKSTESAALLLAQRKVAKMMSLVDILSTSEETAKLTAFIQFTEAEPEPVFKERPELKSKGDYEGHIDKYDFKSENVIELLKGLKAKFEEKKLQTTKEETNSINAYQLAKEAREDETNAFKASKTAKTKELSDAKAELASASGTLAQTQADLKADTDSLESTEKSCALKQQEWTERSETRKLEMEAMEEAIKILSKVSGVRTDAPSNPVPPANPAAAEGASFLQNVDPKTRAVMLLRQNAHALHSAALARLAQQVAAHLTGPFDEVNNMIEKMIFRLMAEQKDEDDHKNWCDLELSKTNASKVDKEDKVSELSAKIDEATATIQQLTVEIKEDEEMVSAITSHMKEAEEIRLIGKKENQVSIDDAQAAQTALANAVAVLEDFYKDSGMVPKEPWEFIQGVDLPAKPATWDSSYTGIADPTNQPSGIITLLKKVSADFATMEADTKAQEASDQKAYEEDMKLSKIESARHKKDAEVKGAERKRLEEKVESMTSTQKEVSKQLEAVVQYIKDLQHACVDGDSTYEDRKAARAKEIEALHQAKQMLADAFKADESLLEQKEHNLFLRGKSSLRGISAK